MNIFKSEQNYQDPISLISVRSYDQSGQKTNCIMSKIRKLRNLKFIILTIFFFLIPKCAIAQFFNFYDPYSFGLQLQLQQQQQQILEAYSQQMNDIYYSITPDIIYKTTDGITLTIEIGLHRYISFSNVECQVKNQSGTKVKNIEYRTFGGDVFVPVGGSSWTIQQGDVLNVYFDNGKSWSYTFGKDLTPQDWSAYYKKQLEKAIEDYNEKNNTYQDQSIPTFMIPQQANQIDNSVIQSNRQSAASIDIQISQLQRKLSDAESSLRLYQQWENERPGISSSQLVQSARQLVDTYSQQIYNLQLEKASLDY